MRLQTSCATIGGGALWTVVLIVALAEPAAARPDFLVRFQGDPMRKAGMDGCGACHVKPDGGGARNDFGSAFDAANREITPLLRANFPSHFAFPAVTLPDGAVFSFSDPQSRVVVVERNANKAVVAMADLATPKEAPLPPPANRMSFFVTSEGVPRGGQLGGLAGADRRCQTLAEAAGAADRTWRAYLSSSFKGAAAANAGDRIGTGPWHNAKGVLVARGAVDLHTKGPLDASLFLTEKGDPVGDVVVLTGTKADGTAAVDRTCDNWTGTSGDGASGSPKGAWNSGAPASCAAPTGPPQTAPRLYCFALKSP